MERHGFLTKLFGGGAAYPLVKSIERLELQPDDTLVLTVEGHPSMERMASLKELLESRFPGQKVLVVDSDISVSVIRKQ